MTRFIQTVCGPISPESLGNTLTHEHIRVDYTDIFVQPHRVDHQTKIKTINQLTLDVLGFVRQYPYSVIHNLEFDKVSLTTLIDELKDYKRAGGHSIVEVTTYSKPHYYEDLKKISEESGVQIICSTACRHGHTDDEKTISENMISDLTVGRIGRIKAGCIGEIKCNSFPMNYKEKSVLIASAKAQKETGAPLMIHPARNEKSTYEIVDILRENGADISKTIIAHLDRTFSTKEALLKFASYSNCFLEFDLFGIEVSHYQYNDQFDFPSDAEKIQMIKPLMEPGYEDRVVISHDIHTRHRLIKYGGHGYGHILENIVPKMRSRGLTDEFIGKMLHQNPRKWLSMGN